MVNRPLLVRIIGNAHAVIHQVHKSPANIHPGGCSWLWPCGLDPLICTLLQYVGHSKLCCAVCSAACQTGDHLALERVVVVQGSPEFCCKPFVVFLTACCAVQPVLHPHPHLRSPRPLPCPLRHSACAPGFITPGGQHTQKPRLNQLECRLCIHESTE